MVRRIRVIGSCGSVPGKSAMMSDEYVASEPSNAADRLLDDAGIGGDQPDVWGAKRGFLLHDAANPDPRESTSTPSPISIRTV